MKLYAFKELGYFTESVCKAIKEEMDGDTFMNFTVRWGKYADNCILMVETDYDGTEEEIKTMFIHCVLGRMLTLKRLRNLL